MSKVWGLVAVIGFSTLWLYILTIFAPTVGNAKTELLFPSTLEELQRLAASLKLYANVQWWYVFLLFSSAYLYKQAFCIPGSLFLNMLSGALYGSIGGLLFSCFFTACGATTCYTISNIFAKDSIEKYFPEKLKSFEEKVQDNRKRLFFYMLFLRLVPISPQWIVNLASPLVGIPLKIFFPTAFIGLGPYNLVGVSAGVMLSSLNSVNDVFTWSTFLNIAIIALLSLGPAFLLKTQKVDKSN